MAMVQAGMGLGRVVLLIGAGLAAPTVLKNVKFSDMLGGLSEILREKGADGASSAADLVAKDVAQISSMIRQSLSNNVVTVQVDPGNGAVSALVAPAAAVGAVSYCYIWWKGISLSSLMYVTKRNMANAVASMTKHLEHLQSSLAAAKRHLTQRIQHIDDKLDQQKQISGQIKDEVADARLKLKSIGSDMHSLKDIVMGLDEKMDSIEAKQEGLQRTVKRLADNNSNLPVSFAACWSQAEPVISRQGLGIRELLTIESARHSGGRTLPSTMFNSARLMLP